MAILNDGRTSVDVTGNKTLALADCGTVQNVIADGTTVTLPASAAGLNYIIRNGGAAPAGTPAGTGSDASVLLTIAPNGTDTLGGLGFTPASGKGAQSIKATSRVGDFIKIQGGAAGTWVVEQANGTWTKTP